MHWLVVIPAPSSLPCRLGSTLRDSRARLSRPCATCQGGCRMSRQSSFMAWWTTSVWSNLLRFDCIISHCFFVSEQASSRLAFWFTEIAVLENVLGIKKVLAEVKTHIAKELPGYTLCLKILCPWLDCSVVSALMQIFLAPWGFKFLFGFKYWFKFTTRTSFGLNVRRPRYYFILIKNEFLKQGPSSLEQKVDDALDKLLKHYDGEVISWSHPQPNFNALFGFPLFFGFYICLLHDWGMYCFWIPIANKFGLKRCKRPGIACCLNWYFLFCCASLSHNAWKEMSRRKTTKGKKQYEFGKRPGSLSLAFLILYVLRYDGSKATKEGTSLAAHSPQVHLQAQGGRSQFIRTWHWVAFCCDRWTWQKRRRITMANSSTNSRRRGTARLLLCHCLGSV